MEKVEIVRCSLNNVEYKCSKPRGGTQGLLFLLRSTVVQTPVYKTGRYWKMFVCMSKKKISSFSKFNVFEINIF